MTTILKSTHKSFLTIAATLLTVTLSLAGSPRPARAQVVYSNLPNLSSGNEMTHWIQANDFTLSSAVTLTSIRFWSLDNTGVYQGSISYNIYANNGANSPGALLFSGNTAAVTRTTTGGSVLGQAEHINDFAVSIPLTAGTYWLGLHNGPLTTTSTENFFWESANANGTFQAKEDVAPFGDGFNTNGIEYAFVLTASASAAPEPGTLTLLALGGIGFVARKRRFAWAGTNRP